MAEQIIQHQETRGSLDQDGMARNFRSVKEIVAFVNTVAAKDRYNAQAQILGRMLNFHERSREIIEEVFEYVRKSGEYRGHITEEEFGREWEGVTVVVEENKKARSRRLNAEVAILEEWPEEGVKAWLAQSEMTTSYIEGVRYAAKRLSFAEATRRVNDIVAQRVATPRRGVSSALYPLTSD